MDVGLAREHGDQIVPTPERLVGLGQLVGGLTILRIELQDRVVGAEHHRIELELVAIDREQVLELGQPSGAVVLRQRIELAAQQLHQRVPLARAAVQLLERGERLGVVGLAAQHVLEGIDGALGSLRIVLGKARDLERQADLVLLAAEPALGVREHRQELGGLARGRVLLAVEVEHHGLRRVGLAQAREIGLRALGALEHAPVHHADLQQNTLLGVGLQLTGTQRVFVQRNQVVP